MREGYVKSGPIEELPDGSFLTATPSEIAILADPLYTNITLSSDKSTLTTRIFRDSNLCELKLSQVTKQISNPTRFEMWLENEGHREAGRNLANKETEYFKQIMG